MYKQSTYMCQPPSLSSKPPFHQISSFWSLKPPRNGWFNLSFSAIDHLPGVAIGNGHSSDHGVCAGHSIGIQGRSAQCRRCRWLGMLGKSLIELGIIGDNYNNFKYKYSIFSKSIATTHWSIQGEALLCWLSPDRDPCSFVISSTWRFRGGLHRWSSRENHGKMLLKMVIYIYIR